MTMRVHEFNETGGKIIARESCDSLQLAYIFV